jgi:DNA-nicking Smr family endonuclease
MRDVKPLTDRDKVRRRSSAIAAPTGRAAARRTRFAFPRPDEPLLGHAGGIQRRQLERLRSGQIRPEASIDLHHLQTEEARAALHRRLIEAHDAGQRCVVVIHGRGLRSERGPVLKRALPTWLTDAAVAHRILAFAPARSEDGGEGATYVLLRRNRE